MRISYLINQYPKVSHSFIRREILALERQGYQVQRVAQRGWQDTIVDSQDKLEREQTQYIVKQGLIKLVFAVLKNLIINPFKFLQAFKLSFCMASKSEVSLPYHLIYLAEACQLSIWLKAHGSQHLHAHFGTNSAEIAMYASMLSGVPYSFTTHGPEEFDKPISLGLSHKIKHAKFVVAISSFGRSQLYRWCEYLDWQKIKVVHCGLEADFYQNMNTALPKGNAIVCVGRICEQKGQLLLIEAVNQLQKAQIDFNLILAGDGEMRAEVERLIHLYHLEGKVHITGWISSQEVREYLLNARMLVLPSFAEGLPVVIMEAMSLKRPVISTYIAGIPELVQDGVNGWLCTAGDVNALVERLKVALSASNDALTAMGEMAFERVTARHDIDKEAAKLSELIKS